MYELKYKKSALKSMLKLPVHMRSRIKTELVKVAVDPYSYQGDWGPLSGSPYWRLRVGGYRAICAIEKDELLLLVLKVGPRGGIYK